MHLLITVILIAFLALFALLSLPMTLEEPVEQEKSNQTLMGQSRNS